MVRLLAVCCLALLLTSCSTGYRRSGGMWVWVSYDASVGKRVVPLDPHDAASFRVLRPREQQFRF
ncbi:MAG: hypothetical protein OHK0039_08370 [Bacteroidia bacterium]